MAYDENGQIRFIFRAEKFRLNYVKFTTKHKTLAKKKHLKMQLTNTESKNFSPFFYLQNTENKNQDHQSVADIHLWLVIFFYSHSFCSLRLPAFLSSSSLDRGTHVSLCLFSSFSLSADDDFDLTLPECHTCKWTRSFVTKIKHFRLYSIKMIIGSIHLCIFVHRSLIE